MEDESPKLSAKSLNVGLQAMITMLNWCQRRGYIAENPLRNVGKVLDVREAPFRRALTPAESEALIQACPPHRQVAYLLPLYLGLRREEVAAVKWGDLEYRDGACWLRVPATAAKNHRSSYHKVPDFVAKVIERERPAGSRSTDTILANGMPRVPTFRRDLKAAGVPFLDARGSRADIHALRHTYITRCQESGASLAELKLLARHTDIKTTARYLHASQSRVHQIIDALPTMNLDGGAPRGAPAGDTGAHGMAQPDTNNGQQKLS